MIFGKAANSKTGGAPVNGNFRSFQINCIFVNVAGTKGLILAVFA
jgi:hypothetical protein